MNKKWRSLLRTGLFAAGGALVGYVYYRSVGCATGTCPITASPVNSMLYMALIGWLLSQLFQKEREDECSM